MCGIYASISRRKDLAVFSNALRGNLTNRGPDHIGNVQRAVGSGGEAELHLNCVATVLSLRGHGLTQQPLVSQSTSSILCWNGEAWAIKGRPVTGNDGAAVLAALDAAVGHEAILDVFRAVEGPFAFIYYDARDGGRVYFCRDRLGRRSLLVHDEDDFFLSSVADPGIAGWREVEADGVYVLHVGSLGDVRSGSVAMRAAERHGWLPEGHEGYVSCGDLYRGVVTAAYHGEKMSNIGLFNTALPPEDCPPLEPGSRPVQTLREHLTRSLSLRVLKVPEPPLCTAQGVDTRIAILFSGGLDCTVLARLASELLPESQGIDLINVAFENPRIAARLPADRSPTAIYEACPDRITGRKSFSELCDVCPGRQWRFVSVSRSSIHQIADASGPLTIRAQVNVPYAETQSHRSQVVALMHPHNTEMDLSIAYALYFAARGEGLAQTTPETSGAEPYSTAARVLLSGLGADELFGGYVRHATAFSRTGYPGLIEELKLDVGRLGKRNLGRDDRVMSHWGREVRFPFLDEGLVVWAVEAPVWEKCDFAAAAGGEADAGSVEPEKRVLRLLAQQLGMHSVAREKKRAVRAGDRSIHPPYSSLSSSRMIYHRLLTSGPYQIQFGSRTAKMENGKVKGTHLITQP